ncbi:MAG: fumarylacetoacetate hydrolase [Candidatus Rokubacteria bacterium]|nr:fumarylacetoacetate hydrolase [Candidatus Rokubacteria bacterium]
MTPRPALSARECLPRNRAGSLLIGRTWMPAEDGPAVIAVRGDDAVDLTGSYPTVSQLLNTAIAIRRGRGSSPPAISRR